MSQSSARAALHGFCLVKSASVTRCGRHSGGVGCNWAGCGLECAIIERLTSPHEAALLLHGRPQRANQGSKAMRSRGALRMTAMIAAANTAMAKKAQRSLPDESSGCGKRQDGGWTVHSRSMTGLGAVDYGVSWSAY